MWVCMLEPGGTHLMEVGNTWEQKCGLNVLLDISPLGQPPRLSLTVISDCNYYLFMTFRLNVIYYYNEKCLQLKSYLCIFNSFLLYTKG